MKLYYHFQSRQGMFLKSSRGRVETHQQDQQFLCPREICLGETEDAGTKWLSEFFFLTNSAAR